MLSNSSGDRKENKGDPKITLTQQVIALKTIQERRTETRCQAGDCLQAMIRSGNGPPLTLRNICCNGLALEYADGAHPIGNFVVVDLIAWDNEPATIQALVCRTIYDILTLSENQSFKGQRVRQRGMAFVDPTPLQKQQLKEMMRCRLDSG